MSRNQQNDGLEKFFRKGLNEANDLLMEDTNWDMPSEAVWESIEARLPEVEPRRRRTVLPISRAWLTAAASILLFLFVVDSYFAIQKIGYLQDQVAMQSGKLEQLQANDNKTSLNLPQTIHSNIEQKVNAFLAKANAPLLDNIAINRIETEHSIQTLQRPLVLPLQSELAEHKDYAVVDNNNNIAITPNTEEPFHLLPLDVASQDFTSFPVMNSYAAKNTSMTSVTSVLSRCAKKRSFYAGVFAGPSRWINHITSDHETIAGNKVTKQIGVETGVKVGFQINENWAVETGLSYVTNTQEMKQQMTLTFNPENERPGANGSLESNYEAKVNTPYGNSTMAVQLFRNPEQTLLPGEAMDAEFTQDITTALLQVPVLTRYGLQKGKLNVSLSAGVLLSFLQKQEINTSETRIASHPELGQEQLQIKRGEVPATEKMHYAVQTGLQLAYQASPAIEFYVAPTYIHGLTSIAESEGSSTTLAQASLQAGVHMRF